MSPKNGMVQTGLQRFGPQSLPGLVAWFVVGLVVLTHPMASAKVAWAASWGTARFVGHQAFGDCGEAPPFGWMEPKTCPPPAPAPAGVEGQADTDPATDGQAADYRVFGVELPAPDRVWAAANDARTVGEERVIEPGSGGGRP